MGVLLSSDGDDDDRKEECGAAAPTKPLDSLAAGLFSIFSPF